MSKESDKNRSKTRHHMSVMWKWYREPRSLVIAGTWRTPQRTYLVMMWKLSVLATLGVAVVGCNSEDARDLNRDAGNLASSASKAASNAELVVRINAALAQTKGVSIDGLHIEARKGVVTVGGHVHSQAEKDTVLRTTESIKGVESVIDDLRVASH